ncbi:MAG TPA: hypothetical protein PLI48_03870 [Gammaproteobacteria bacterium]|nr:hypothetical protein [Gammaproteobacteria bacterium]HRP85973.1 hypothetical protein [Gammaproteobacteria bacterium]
MPLPIPAIGDWYQAPTGVRFEVIAVDDEDGSIDIQHFDGTVEEIEFDAWEESEFLPADPPEDYSGSLDIERDDYGMDLDRAAVRDWSDPLDFLDQAE